MTDVQPVGESDFEEVYEAVLAADAPEIEPAAWRRLFEWGDAGEPRGWAIRAGGRIVGFLGGVIRRRVVRGSEAVFCNVHSWIVEPDHRGWSLHLLRPVLSRKELVVTDFTPTPEVDRIDRRLGFERLDARMRILPPTLGRGEAAEVDLDPDSVARRLGPDDARAMADHRGEEYGHAWIGDDAEGCWVAYSVVDRYPLRHVLVHHVGDPAAFARASRTLRDRLLDRHEARFVAVPDRLVEGVRVPASVRLPIASHQRVRCAGAPPRVDTLYSEVAALGLTTLPDASAWLGDLLRRWTGRGS